MSWITPKTDWQSTDYINYGDFNRIENNIIEIANYLRSITYNIPALTTVTNRDNTSIEFLSSINRIENNLELIRTNFVTPIGWQSTKTWILGNGFTNDDANRIENNIQLLMNLGVLTFQNFKYIGTFSCGETGVIY
jgi:hypothetical protein